MPSCEGRILRNKEATLQTEDVMSGWWTTAKCSRINPDQKLKFSKLAETDAEPCMQDTPTALNPWQAFLQIDFFKINYGICIVFCTVTIS